jgi:hypothetical protein
VVLGISETLPMLAGPAASIDIRLPNGGSGADGTIPADGTTQVVLTIEVHDASTNLVADGTPVACSPSGDGDIVGEREVVTASGIAQCTYRAGKMPGTGKVTVEVDGVEAEKEIVNQALTLTLSFDKPYVLVGEEVVATLTARSEGGEEVADGTEVGWLALNAKGTRDETVMSGQAQTRFHFDTENLYSVLAVVAGAHVVQEIGATTQATLIQIRQARRFVAGDLPADGNVSFPQFDGTTTDVWVKTSDQITITGGVPGQSVRLAVGTLGAPNRLPEAEYLMETLADGAVVDTYGRHPGQATGAVSVDTVDRRNSYRFAGGAISIGADGPFVQPSGLGVSMLVKPASAGTLLKRSGSFALALVDGGAGLRVRLTAWSGGQERVVESVAAVAPEAWTQVGVRLEGSSMTLQVGEEEHRQDVGVIDAGSGDLVAGESFTGNLDELRLFHTSGASPPLLLIEGGSGNGHEEGEATFDASGTAFFTVRGTGALALLDQPSAFQPDGDTPLQASIRAHFVGMRVGIQDGSYRSLGTQVLGKQIAAALTRVGEALLAGGGDGQIPVVILDAVLGFTPFGVITTARDVAFALERVALGAANGGDALTLSTVALTLIFAAVITKRFQAAGHGFLALKSLHRLRTHGKALANLGKWLRRAGEDEAFAQRLESTLRILTQHGDEVTDAAIEVFEVAEKNWRHMVYLEQTLKAAGDAAPDVIRALRQTLTSGEDVLRTTLAVTRTADRVTPKVVSAGTKIAKAIEAARAAKVATPGIARLNNMLKNFPSPLTREILEKLDDIVDDSTQGLRFIVTQLGVLRAPRVFIADATEAVVRYALGKSRVLGKKVAAFERKVEVPQTKPWHKRFHRQYDASFALGGDRFLDIDVKNWTPPFRPFPKEGWKLQKDIVIHFLDPARRNFNELRWAIPKSLQGNRAAIEQWMLKQFDSRLVKSRIDPSDLPLAKAEFQKALNSGLIEFY